MKSSTALREIDKPHYRYWHALYRAFFSAKLYVDVAKRWRGLALLYLLLLVAILAIPVWIRSSLDFSHFFEEEIRGPMRSMPTLYVQKGIVSTDKVTPFMIKDKSGHVVIIIDTSGHVNEIDSKKYPHVWALITRDSMVYKMPTMPVYFSNATMPGNVAQTMPFDKRINQVFDGRSWEKMANLNRLQWQTQAMLYPIIVLTFYGMYCVFVLVLGMMLQLFAQVLFHTMLTFKEVCRLLAVASTMPLTFFFFLLTINHVFRFSGWMLLGFLMLYYIFGVLSVRAESQRMVRY